jgi:hypothetical protein
MKAHNLFLPILALVALNLHPLSIASSTKSAPSANECSDCGCKGPKSDKTCPDEKGKTCHCKP